MADGPGVRAALWVQGCSIRCKGCFNSDTLSHAIRRRASTDEILQAILDLPDVEGLSLTGGEPFEQPIGLGKLAEQACAHGLNVVSFTGYTLEQLQSHVPHADALLRHVDLLIAGPFVPPSAPEEPTIWGSVAKKLHPLTGRVPLERAEAYARVHIRLSFDGTYADMSGILPPGVLAAVRKAVQEGHRRTEGAGSHG